jgi:DNA-binding NtrC family response regulator
LIAEGKGIMENGKKRILIIEDDEEMRSLLKDFLEEEDDYEADSANNGSEGFRKLAREHFDLVITDIRMPGLTGLDILPGIRKLQPVISIIVITAFGSEDIYRKAFERGATAYLEKPIKFHKLRALIREIIPQEC